MVGKRSDGSDPDEPGGASALDPYGRGKQDPRTGLYEWYEIPPADERGLRAHKLTYEEILSQWALIEADWHSEYGQELTPGLLGERSWRWFRVRLGGLLAADTRLARQLAEEREDGSAELEARLIRRMLGRR